MAVVQISKIQVRRGQKNTGIGVPQLSSAEFAWAVDSQELFIGNGSVSEGAPYVGNTKILTEHDNILELASSYRFAGTDTSIINAIPRSLQSKLDEYVSVLDFGAVADGSTDNVDAFERAFADLFQNQDAKFKKILYVPNGIYLFTSDLRIPSTAIIVGENKERTILNIGNNNILFVTEAGDEVGDFSSSNRPSLIKISNLTIDHLNGELVLTGIKDSSFTDMTFKSTYELGDTVASLATRSASVFWENNLDGIKTDNIEFNNCLWNQTPLAVKCSQTIDSKTSVKFKNCKFSVVETGIYVDGFTAQKTSWRIKDCEFDEVYSRAMYASAGRGTIISTCTFTNCGNGLDLPSLPNSPIIEFGDPLGNVVSQCSFDRHQEGHVTSLNNVPAVTEVLNSGVTSLSDRHYSDIYKSDGFRPLAVFPAANKFTIVNYLLHLGGYSRVGQLVITLGDDLAGSEDVSEVSISDNYSYSASSSTAPGGSLMTSFEFSVTLTDNDSDSGIETMVLNYMNPLDTGEIGTISYSVSYGV